MPERDSSGQPSVEEQLRALYDNAESGAARAFEQAVSTPSFGALLARSAENVAALSRIGSDVADLVLRNLRVASRADITRLARQLHRTEDKLERVLQEIEQLRDELAAADHRDARDDAEPDRDARDDAEPPAGRGGASPSRGRAAARSAPAGRGGATTRNAADRPSAANSRSASAARSAANSRAASNRAAGRRGASPRGGDPNGNGASEPGTS